MLVHSIVGIIYTLHILITPPIQICLFMLREDYYDIIGKIDS